MTAVRTITPSAMSTWHGSPCPGSRWSAEQVRTLHEARRDPGIIPTAWIVLRVYPGGDRSQPLVDRELLVPVLARTRRGDRALIVTPAGEKLWKDVR